MIASAAPTEDVLQAIAVIDGHLKTLGDSYPDRGPLKAKFELFSLALIAFSYKYKLRYPIGG